MGVRKRKPMVNYTWLNVDFENSFGVDYLQQPLKWKGEPPIKCLQYKTIQYLFIYDLCQPILNKGRVTVWPFFGPRWIWLKFEYLVV